LVVGECGVPYLLGDQPNRGNLIQGEVYAVDAELLAGMDDYEGVSKSYYERRQIAVTNNADGTTLSAWVYLLSVSDDHLRQLPYIPEYTKAIHDQFYMPIKHIQIKQQRYLGLLESYTVKT
jgi:hypothetical protein